MTESSPWSLRAAKTFATATVVILLSIVFTGYLTSNTRGSLLFGVIFSVMVAFIAGIIAAAMWEIVVERNNRLSVSVRGVIAGVLTGWFIIPVALLAYFAVNPPPAGFDIEVAVLTLGFGLITGVFYLGWLTIPAGAVIGYWLARRRIVDLET